MSGKKDEGSRGFFNAPSKPVDNTGLPLEREPAEPPNQVDNSGVTPAKDRRQTLATIPEDPLEAELDVTKKPT